MTRPDLDAIEAYCADFEVVGEAGSTCAACDGPWMDHEECATGVLLTLVAYARTLEKALGAADRMRAELSAWHIDHARGCWGNTNTAVLQRRVDEYDAARPLLAPERGATEESNQ